MGFQNMINSHDVQLVNWPYHIKSDAFALFESDDVDLMSREILSAKFHVCSEIGSEVISQKTEVAQKATRL